MDLEDQLTGVQLLCKQRLLRANSTAIYALDAAFKSTTGLQYLTGFEPVLRIRSPPGIYLFLAIFFQGFLFSRIFFLKISI